MDPAGRFFLLEWAEVFLISSKSNGGSCFSFLLFRGLGKVGFKVARIIFYNLVIGKIIRGEIVNYLKK